MSNPSIIGVDQWGAYLFTAILDSDRNVWRFTHKQMAGCIAEIHGGIEAVVTTLLNQYPDIDSIDYRDDKGRLHNSRPRYAIPNHIATLVAEELTR